MTAKNVIDAYHAGGEHLVTVLEKRWRKRRHGQRQARVSFRPAPRCHGSVIKHKQDTTILIVGYARIYWA